MLQMIKSKGRNYKYNTKKAYVNKVSRKEHSSKSLVSELYINNLLAASFNNFEITIEISNTFLAIQVQLHVYILEL